MKKKILFILHLPPPIHGAAINGKYILDSKLINETFECDYINLSTSKKLSDIGKLKFFKVFVFIGLCFRVLLVNIKNRYDLCYITINSNGLGYYKDLVIVFILKLFGRKISYHYHNKGIAQKQGRIFQNLLYSFQFKNTKAILGSPILYNDVAKYLSKKNVHYCASGIPEISGMNLNLINSQRSIKAIPEVLFLSNMMKEKGVFILLEAYKILYSKGIIFKLIFLGDWVDITEAEFTKFIFLNKLQENVIYAGKKYGTDKAVYFENADIFVFPTFYHNEVFPLVILEAMQYGLPIISTSEGGIPDIVSQNETGYLVEKRDAKGLADKIQYLIENPNVRRSMGVASKLRFEKLFTLSIFSSNFIKILNTIIEETHNTQEVLLTIL